MKKLLVIALIFAFPASFAKLSDRQSMKCIDTDRLTKSVFQDLQTAYDMRLVTAKNFFQVMDMAPSCPQLRKDLKKLHASAISQFPQQKGGLSRPGSYSSGGSSSNSDGGVSYDNNNHRGSFNEDLDMGFPPPPPLPESDFDDDDDFGDFR